jgi:hypothetical protein
MIEPQRRMRRSMPFLDIYHVEYTGIPASEPATVQILG